MARILLVISASPNPSLPTLIDQDQSPRKDYVELARAAGAAVLYRDAVHDHRWSQFLARVAGVSIAQAALAFFHRDDYETVFTDAENIGIPLAILFKLAHVRRRHVMLGHLLTTRPKRLLFRWLRLGHHIDAVICHSSLQRFRIERQLHVPAQRIALMPYQVDERFWRPLNRATSAQICSAGLEFRDYPTLIAAVGGLDTQVVLAAASFWSKRRNEAQGIALPPNVHVTSLDYAHLRELYAASLFTVVPLHTVPFQAGITVILESMAMGKAVIVSRVPGQTDVVRDRDGLPSINGAMVPPGFGHAIEGDVPTLDQTGLYVAPDDPQALKDAIRYLLDHPEEAARMGTNGRRLVERLFTLDAFVQRVVKLLAPDG